VVGKAVILEKRDWIGEVGGWFCGLGGFYGRVASYKENAFKRAKAQAKKKGVNVESGCCVLASGD